MADQKENTIFPRFSGGSAISILIMAEKSFLGLE